LPKAPFFYAWRRDGDVYLFRNRNWFLEKVHNVPERDLRRWREHLTATGRLTLEGLAELAPLSLRQLRSVSNAGIPTDSVLSHGPVLWLYAALYSLQRTRLATGVQVRQLSASQIELLCAWKPAAVGSNEAWLRLRQERDSVVFSLDTDRTAPQEERVLLEQGGPATRG
jgi:hypothetical protein